MKTTTATIAKISLLLIILIILATQIGAIIDLSGRKSLLTERERDLEKVKNEQNSLKKKASIVNTPEFIEKEAREKLGMGRDGETIVLLPPSGRETVNNDDDSSSKLPVWSQWLKLIF